MARFSHADNLAHVFAIDVIEDAEDKATFQPHNVRDVVRVFEIEG